MTIYKRGDGIYEAKVWDRAKRSYRYIGRFPTRELAERAVENSSPRSMTVKVWDELWLSDYARPAASTQHTYRYAVKQIVKELGGLALDELDRPTARKQAGKWPRGTARVARTMWADAVRDGVCQLNPWTDMRLETPRGRKDLTALTEDEIRELAEVAREQHGDWGLEARAIILTLGYVGLRPGELFALRWEDLDMENNEVLIARSIDSRGNEKAPKNGKPRLVMLPPPAVAAIQAVPQPLEKDARVFHSMRGAELNKTNFAFAWRSIASAWVERHGRRLQAYELRHACATLLLERGLTPADCAYQLGHSDGGRLVSVLYGHPEDRNIRTRLKLSFAGEESPGVGVEKARRTA